MKTDFSKLQCLPKEIDLKIFMYFNVSIFIFYATIAGFAILKTGFKRLDSVSLNSSAAIFISFLIRAINWIIIALKKDENQSVEEYF